MIELRCHPALHPRFGVGNSNRDECAADFSRPPLGMNLFKIADPSNFERQTRARLRSGPRNIVSNLS
jgi:hypothetical protein